MLCFAVYVALIAAPQDPQSHPFGVDDMLAMDRIGDAQVSPDGTQVAFTLRTTDMENNKGRTDVWVAAVDGSGTRQLTTDPAGDWHARWMPDGQSLVFLSTRGGSSQVWRLPLDGGQPQVLTDLPLDVDNLFVFPDGERLGFTLEVYPDAVDLAQTVEHDQRIAADPVTARVYDSLLYRHWDRWEDGKRKHVFVWTIGSEAPIDLMTGMDADSPTNPFGGAEEIAVSPDGGSVVFAAKDEGASAAWSTNVDLWMVPADGSSAPRRLTENNPAYDNGPSFSPDGKWLAWTAMRRPGYESDRRRIALMDLATGEERVLTEEWDRSAAGIAWSSDSSTIYTTAADLGHRSLFAIDVASGEVTRLHSEGTCAGPAVVAGGRVLFAHDSLRAPVELMTVAPDGSDLQALTDINAEKMAVARIGEYEQFTFTGAHGDEVHGFVLKPVDFEEGQKYPVAFLVHGGPQGSFGDHFHYRWNPQAYAGAGYAAVFIDFHGSTGYGQEFTDAINQDWGGAPFEDLMKGLDHALATYEFLDGERVGALGASFGGYMINWIAGHSDRFKCLVNHDGNLDERLAYFDTEELWFPEWDHGGVPWENPEGYEKHNPINHVGNWKTPMLVIHGALDYRVVDTQGMSTFTALQRRGIPSRFVYFPDENHWVLKPHNSRFWHQEVIAWLDRWCKP